MLEPFDCPRYKVASRTVVDDLPLVQKIVATGKETFISLGMWKEKALPLPKIPTIRYLWCLSQYPTAPWDLIYHYSYPEGLSHHYNETVIAALKARGIRCSPSAIHGLNPPQVDLFHLHRVMVGFHGAPFPWDVFA